MFWILLVFGVLGIVASIAKILSFLRTSSRRESDHRIELTRIEARRDAVVENYEKDDLSQNGSY